MDAAREMKSGLEPEIAQEEFQIKRCYGVAWTNNDASDGVRAATYFPSDNLMTAWRFTSRMMV